MRIYSDATGEGNMAGLVIFPESSGKIPVVFTSKADRALTGLAAWTNKIYVFELFAAAATVFPLRQQLTGKKIVLFVDNEAACADLSGGTAKNRCALLLVYTLWSVVAQFDLQRWIGRVPSAQNPADLPFRNRALSPAAEAQQELPDVSQMSNFCDLSRLFQK